MPTSGGPLNRESIEAQCAQGAAACVEINRAVNVGEPGEAQTLRVAGQRAAGLPAVRSARPVE